MHESFDCLLVGGGAIGLAGALRLREHGLRVAVVERGPLGGEASSAAGGILAPQCEAEGPGPMLELCLQSRALWPGFAAGLQARSDVDPAYRDDGALALAFDAPEAEHLSARIAWQKRAGLAVEELTPSELAKREPSLSRALLAARFPGDHQVDNLRVVHALAEAARRAGVVVIAAEARAIETHSGRSSVVLDGGAVHAEKIVVTAGSWSAQLGVPAVAPVRGQMIELAVAPPMRHVIFGDGGYLVPRGDGRVLCGSTEERCGFEKAVTPEGLERQRLRVARLCPELAKVPTARSWSGLRPGTPDGLPLLGTREDGVVIATGHFRNGILLLPITATIIASLVTGVAPPLPLEPFSPARLPQARALH